MPRFRDGIKVLANGIRRFDREFRVSVLDCLDKGESEAAVCLQFHITKRELKRIVCWRKRIAQVPERKLLVLKEKTLRERLYHRAVDAVEESLDPLEKVVAKSPILRKKGGMEYLPTAVGHLRNRGQNAIKTLEGLGDFRRGGDEIPRDAPRQPLFNLPAGSHVAVRLEITTPKEGVEHAIAERGGGEGEEGNPESGATPVDTPLQDGEPPC